MINCAFSIIIYFMQDFLSESATYIAPTHYTNCGNYHYAMGNGGGGGNNMGGSSLHANTFQLPSVHLIHLSKLKIEVKPPPPDLDEMNAEDGGGVGDGDECECTQTPIASSSIYNHICRMKLQIEQYSEIWDNVKKFTNPYEFIHTNVPGHKTSVSKLRPISRSFYKMIEMCQTMRLLDKYKHSKSTLTSVSGIRTFHLAEGPGGFIEAVSYLRGLQCNGNNMLGNYSNGGASGVVGVIGMNGGGGGAKASSLCRGGMSINGGNSNNNGMTGSTMMGSTGCCNGYTSTTKRLCVHDQYYGMTLIDDDPICPGWKKTRTFLDANPNVMLEHGCDNTGNILHADNFASCCEKYKNSMDLVTADGGFDFSVDFNKQEHLAVNLIVAEVFFALALQKKGGSFVLKIFDMFFKPTIDVVYLLCSLYDDVNIMKPHTSRIANSEKYVVCTGFKLDDSSAFIEKAKEMFILLAPDAAGVGIPHTITSILDFEHDTYFLSKIEDANAMLGQQQIENIATTLHAISHKNNDKLEHLKKHNLQKCISWCDKFNIPYHRMTHSVNIFLSS